MMESGLCGRIGTIVTNSSACPDDVCILSTSKYDTQLLINMASSYAAEERYLLQPTKTVAVTLNATLSEGLHLGITRTSL